jgi:hypothetical protein
MASIFCASQLRYAFCVNNALALKISFAAVLPFLLDIIARDPKAIRFHR